jgi:hypothetical protein
VCPPRFSDEHKGYHCLDLVSGRVHVSHHVTFAENIFPFSERHPQDPTSSTSSPSPPRRNNFPFFQQPNHVIAPVAAAQPAKFSTTAVNPAASSPAATSTAAAETADNSAAVDFQPPPTPASASSVAPGASSHCHPSLLLTLFLFRYLLMITQCAHMANPVFIYPPKIV